MCQTYLHRCGPSWNEHVSSYALIKARNRSQKSARHSPPGQTRRKCPETPIPNEIRIFRKSSQFELSVMVYIHKVTKNSKKATLKYQQPWSTLITNRGPSSALGQTFSIIDPEQPSLNHLASPQDPSLRHEKTHQRQSWGLGRSADERGECGGKRCGASFRNAKTRMFERRLGFGRGVFWGGAVVCMVLGSACNGFKFSHPLMRNAEKRSCI